jgi:hypothetical protein
MISCSDGAGKKAALETFLAVFSMSIGPSKEIMLTSFLSIIIAKCLSYLTYREKGLFWPSFGGSSP